MIELTQASISAAWLITTLLLLLQWMRQGLRKGGGCNAVEGQTEGRTGAKSAARKRARVLSGIRRPRA